nr:Peptide G protein-coupled receptor [Hymenolepis microstoma]CUU98277.1 Peptide G protein-coupled receptor [Hymenolepis microstoma]
MSNETINLPLDPDLSGCTDYPRLHTFDQHYRTIHAYLSLSICLLGIFTNALNAVVLTYSRMRSPTNLLLTSIAIADSITMFAYGGRDIYLHFVTSPDPKTAPHGQAGIYFLLFTNFTTIAAHIASTIMTVMLAIFRSWVLYHPQRQVLYKHIKVTIIIASMLSAAMFILCISTERVGKIDSSTLQSNGTEDYYWFGVREGLDNLDRANFIIYGCFSKLASSILITFFTALILIAMEKARMRYMKLKHRLQNAREDRKNDRLDDSAYGNNGQQYMTQKKRESRGNHRTTVMLVAVVVSFVITEAPQGVLITVTAIADECFMYKVYAPIGDLIDILVLLNASTNFILYCAMSAQFRKSFQELIMEDLIYRICRIGKNGGEDDLREIRKAEQPAETVLVHHI